MSRAAMIASPNPGLSFLEQDRIMSQYKKLFRKEPPKELVEQILRSIGLLGIHDLRWFTKEELKMDAVEEWLPLLYPFYLPCKAKRFLDTEFDANRLITVVRHCIRAHGYDLSVQERLYKDKKHSLYQLQPVHSYKDLSGSNLEVTFD
jgi:hypothetical protein